MIREVYDKLFYAYGKQGWWPLSKNSLYSKHNRGNPKNKKDQFEVCVGAILTQNTNWKNVEKALFNLNKKNMLCKDKIKNTDLKILGELVKPAGYYNQKAKKLKIFANYEGSINRGSLLNLWGLGEETVDSMLLYAYGKPFFVVDSYTKRIFSRLGLIDENDNYGYVQNVFQNKLKKDVELFKEYHALIVEHAKRHCKKKPVCDGCVLRSLCKFNF